MLLLTGTVQATTLSGEFRLDNQDILISGPQKYHGHFDLRYELPFGDEFTLSKVTVRFIFRDDKEWVKGLGPNSLKDTGKVTRHEGSLLQKKKGAGQTDLHYTAKNITYLTNEEEVAELTIGRNVYYGATIRRRDVTREILGQKKMILGFYRDEGDNNRMREHFRITETILETQRDGYDGLFEIRRITLDLATVQDLAHTGLLKFELGGKGDYIFDGAKLYYEGYMTGQAMEDAQESGLFSGSLWLGLFSLPIGGLLWRKKRQTVRPRKGQKRIAQRKIPPDRAF